MKLKIFAATTVLLFVSASFCFAADEMAGAKAKQSAVAVETLPLHEPVVTAEAAAAHIVTSKKKPAWYAWHNFRAEAQVKRSENNQETGSQFSYIAPGVGQETNVLRLMGNLYYDFRNESSLTPYVFGGLGALYVEADQLRLNDVSLSLGARNDIETTLGYQAGAGFSYFIGDDASLDVDYTYFVLEDDPYLSRLNDQIDKHNLTLEFRLKF